MRRRTIILLDVAEKCEKILSACILHAHTLQQADSEGGKSSLVRPGSARRSPEGQAPRGLEPTMPLRSHQRAKDILSFPRDEP